MKKEYVFTELGYFTEGQAKRIKERMDGKSFMNFEVTWSSNAGNCTLIVKTDYYSGRMMSWSEEEEHKEVFNFFMFCVCNEL